MPIFSLLFTDTAPYLCIFTSTAGRKYYPAYEQKYNAGHQKLYLLLLMSMRLVCANLFLKLPILG